MAAETLSIKCNLDGDIRRLDVPRSYDQLTAELHAVYGERDLDLSYTNEDGAAVAFDATALASFTGGLLRLVASRADTDVCMAESDLEPDRMVAYTLPNDQLVFLEVDASVLHRVGLSDLSDEDLAAELAALDLHQLSRAGLVCHEQLTEVCEAHELNDALAQLAKADQKRSTMQDRLAAKLGDPLAAKQRLQHRAEKRLMRVRTRATETPEQRAAKRQVRLQKRLSQAGDQADELSQRFAEKEFKRLERVARKEERLVRQAAFAKLKDHLVADLPTQRPLHIVVDGNNMLGGGPNRLSRDTLLRLIGAFLEKHQSDPAVTLLCLFDRGGDSGVKHGVAFQASPTGVEADDVIAGLTLDENTLVVTSDRGLGVRVMDKGAQVMKSGCFYQMINPGAPNPNARSSDRVPADL